MRTAVAHRFFLDPLEEETLVGRMARDGRVAGGAEDGEISSDSVEEINEEDFKQQDFPKRSSGRSGRVWMGDPRQYSMLRRSYASSLYNFAWAQAVQNKPLGNFIFDEAALSRKPLSGVTDGRDAVNQEVNSEESVAHEEKEEGELEEGEIEMGSAESEDPKVDDNRLESVGEKLVPPVLADEAAVCSSPEEENEMDLAEDFDTQVASVLEELETITEEEAEKSFETCCYRLRKTLDILQRMMSRSNIPVFDALVQQGFVGIQTVYSVYLKGKDQNKDTLLRLLTHLKNYDPSLFATGQMKEINEIIESVVPGAVNKDMDCKPKPEPTVLSAASNIGTQSDYSVVTKFPKLEPLCIPKIKPDYRPLLDPHANHDENSLPSPTQGNAPTLPNFTASISGLASVIKGTTTCKREETDVVHPFHETDGMALSIYQQKYLHASFLPRDRLPSPTPSEDGNDNGGDTQGEVSSSVVNAATSLLSSATVPSIGCSSSTAYAESSCAQCPILSNVVGQVAPETKSVIKTSAKNRDPRLRFADLQMSSAVDRKQFFIIGNSADGNVVTETSSENSRKHKMAYDAIPENHSLKKQKSDCANSRKLLAGKVGWLMDNDASIDQCSGSGQIMEDSGTERGQVQPGEACSARVQNMSSVGAVAKVDQMPKSSPSAISFPSLLKDLVVNPTMFMHIIKEKQRMASEAQQNVISSEPLAVEASSTGNSSKSILIYNRETSQLSAAEKKPAEKLQMSSQSVSNHNDAGTIRMKPRDPRRILHGNMVQKGETDQLKTNGVHPLTLRAKDSLISRGGQQAPVTMSPSQSTPLPEITRQLTKSLKSLANIISTSQVSSQTAQTSVSVMQNMSTIADEVSVGSGASESSNQQSALVGVHSSQTNVPQSCNPWGNVDHLLDGYDDKQKAAIQMERARRIEEQNRMFAARKLCLVLDLDHTLLNSAKFTEVEQIHEEILRKKEEQDREKPQRSLFRFPHMGMWTKLRPGIWTFLEKASRLYELHLYTMGNKMYATEMAKVLDPTGALFSGRVISKGDDGDTYDSDDRIPKSKDLDGVLGMESAVVIIDDSARVWPHHKLNLIVVERYTYFPCSRRQFGLPGPSLLEIDHDERIEDGTLASSLVVVERLHQNFFSHQCLGDIDVRNILSSEQRKILGGCRIVFSRIFPVGEANPHLHPLWQTAEQFGAVCTNQIDDQVTHVVANSLGTDKVNWALSTGRFVVHPGWVEASALLYRRVSEQEFSVKLQMV